MNTESKSTKKLKSDLIKILPFFPNDKETLHDLEGQKLSDVLIYYLHWQTRQVPQRVRKVAIYPEVTSDPRWPILKISINSLLEKVKSGDDLKPYLSLKAHNKGYTPAYRIKNQDADVWADKDKILNSKGFHHFHLDMNVNPSDISDRTNDVLFAKVNRTDFHAIGIFDHSVFDVSNNNELENERNRLFKIHEKYSTLGMKPGSSYFNNPIMCSGHPFHVIRISDSYMDIIEQYDKNLNERSFVNRLYENSKLQAPNKYLMSWHINDLDLCIFDKKNNVLFTIQKWPL